MVDDVESPSLLVSISSVSITSICTRQLLFTIVRQPVMVLAVKHTGASIKVTKHRERHDLVCFDNDKYLLFSNLG